MRSLIILGITAFFAFTPITFSPFRAILISFNEDKPNLLNNLLMFDYHEKSETYLNHGDCKQALVYALKANSSGTLWLGIDVKNNDELNFGAQLLKLANEGSTTTFVNRLEVFLNNYNKNPELLRIGGTYDNLYQVYTCLADNAYENEQFESTIHYYELALKALIFSNSVYNKVWTLSDIAFCYHKLENYAAANQFYLAAIEIYKILPDKSATSLAALYTDFAFYLADIKDFEHSNAILAHSNAILQKDTLTPENKVGLSVNYNKLALNNINLNQYQKALAHVTEAQKYGEQTTLEYCTSLSYKGIILFKLSQFAKAETVLESCLLCHENHSMGKEKRVATTQYFLSQVALSLAKYEKVKKILSESMETVRKNYGVHHTEFANHLYVLAQLNYFVGDYTNSETQFEQVHAVFSKNLGETNYKTLMVLSDLALLKTTVSKPKLAKEYAGFAFSALDKLGVLENHNATNFLNSVGYVDYFTGNYEDAKRHYKNVLSINNLFNLSNCATSASALNGFGLVEMAQKNYKDAAVYFKESLVLHKSIFTDNHPATAMVYLNDGILSLATNKLADAEEKVNRAQTINQFFFQKDHDIFADIYVALGTIAAKKGDHNEAKTNFNKALEIYKNKFESDHQKIVQAQSYLQLLQ